VLQRMRRGREKERERRQGNDQKKESSCGRHLFILYLHTI